MRHNVRIDDLKFKARGEALREIGALLDEQGVPEWVELKETDGVPSNSAIYRLKWYLARRKSVKPSEIDQALQAEMKLRILQAAQHSS